MYHSITFGDKNTWDDWHIVPSSRPVFNPPPFTERYVDIPGSNGSVDLTEAVTGYPVYGNRTGSMEFIVMNEWFKPDGTYTRGVWHERYSEIANYLHGRSMRAVLEDDPEYYYEGRFKISEWRSEKDFSKITVEYNVNPYKWAINTTTEPWLWNPFSFEHGIIENGVYINPVASVTKSIASITTTVTSLTFTSTEIAAMKFSYQQPKFTVTGDTDVKLGITYSGGGAVFIELPHGETTVVPTLFVKNGVWYYNNLVCECVSVSTMDGTASLSMELHPYYEGACAFSGIEISTTPITLAFSEDYPNTGMWPMEAAGFAPMQVIFIPHGTVLTLTATIAGDLQSASVADGALGKFPGLVLYRGKWLLNGQEAVVTAEGLATGTMQMVFRRGLL